MQEAAVKDELVQLSRELVRAQQEVARICAVPLVLGQFGEPIDDTRAIVSSTTGQAYVVRVLSTVHVRLNPG